MEDKKINIYTEPYHWKMTGFYKEKYEYPVKVLEKLLKDKGVLDIGCGDGRLSFLLSKYSKSVTGIDNQMLPLEYAKSLAGNKVSMACCSGERLPFKDASFEAVTLFDVIEHLPVDFHNILLKEVNRVLRDRGVLAITTPNRQDLRRRFSGDSINPKHYFEYTRQELEAVIKNSGYKIIESSGIYVPVLPIVERLYFLPLARNLISFMINTGKIFPRISTTLFLTATK